MIKDFFGTLRQNGEFTSRGYFFIAVATHVFLLATVGFIIVWTKQRKGPGKRYNDKL